MFNLLFGWVKWPQLSKKVCFVLVGIGLSIESLVILFYILVKRFQDSGRYPFEFSSYTLFGTNAVIGFFGTVVVVFGIINLIRMLRVSRWATIWGYAACLSIIIYKSFDVAYSFEALCLEDLLGLSFELDTLIMNLLLIGSAGMLATAMVCALFDLHNAEEVLRDRNRSLDREIQERRLLSAAIQNAAESIEITDAAGTIMYVNPAFERLMGYTQEEILGCSWERLKNSQYKEEFYTEIVDSVDKENVWRGRLVNTQKDGTPITSDAIVSVIRNQNGNIENYIAAKRDVRREELLEKQVLQSQKLEAVGTLAGGIAHDLNNVLAVIIGHSEISMEKLEPEHPVRKSLEVIMRTATRSSQLIKRLLVFSRQDVAEPAPMAPGPLIKEQMKVIRSYLPANIEISDKIESEIGYIMGEPIEIQQIIFNLCTNANHAMQPDGGSLKIGLDCVLVEEEKVPSAGTLKPGKYVHLSVQDTGCGMDETVQSHLFEPFFTTKEVGMGTGLGLAMVHGSVMRSGGAITVSSSPGEGSMFNIFWPRLDYEPKKENKSIEIPDGNGQTILVVDDMVDFKELMEANLVVHGFNPIGFTDATEALAYFQENSEKIDIALVDYMMPGMNGSDFTACLHDVKPELPVVLVSGYSCNVNKDNAAEYGFAAAVSKPVDSAQLIHTIVRCLA